MLTVWHQSQKGVLSYTGASPSPPDLQVDWTFGPNGISCPPRHLPCWQRFASLWKQPQCARPNAQWSPKSCCILVTPCHTGPLYPFWEDKPQHCAEFSKEGDAIVLESGRMTFSAYSSFWHCLLFWNTVHWNAAFLEAAFIVMWIALSAAVP